MIDLSNNIRLSSEDTQDLINLVNECYPHNIEFLLSIYHAVVNNENVSQRNTGIWGIAFSKENTLTVWNHLWNTLYTKGSNNIPSHIFAHKIFPQEDPNSYIEKANFNLEPNIWDRWIAECLLNNNISYKNIKADNLQKLKKLMTVI
jgi:hypothetical protein